jgi:hypothetical protein
MSVAKKVPSDVLNSIEDVLGIFVAPEMEIRHQVMNNTWASLLSSMDKRACYQDLERNIRGYVHSIAPEKINYQFYSGRGSRTAYEIVQDSILHQVSKLQLPITFNTSESSNSSALIYTLDHTDWADISHKITVSMLEEIEDQLSLCAIGALLIHNYDTAPAIFKSFIHTLMVNPSVAVYLFEELDTNALINPDSVLLTVEMRRSLGVPCYIIDTTIESYMGVGGDV